MNNLTERITNKMLPYFLPRKTHDNKYMIMLNYLFWLLDGRNEDMQLKSNVYMLIIIIIIIIWQTDLSFILDVKSLEN